MKNIMSLPKWMKIALGSWLTISFIYINHSFGTNKAVSASDTIINIKNKGYKSYNSTYKGTEKYLINTLGCYIPNYAHTLKFKEGKHIKGNCGLRGVFINKISSEKIEFRIDKDKMNNYSQGKTFQCCYRFAKPLNVAGKIDLKKLEYSDCEPFKNGTRIEIKQEIVTVSCLSKTKTIYEDAYNILKKLTKSKDEVKLNGDKIPWNILILGLDTMSRARLIASMPKTSTYLRQHNWLDFRGYQKVGYNTFPNVMALLTGKNVSAIYKASAKGLNNCNKLLMWSKFKKAGYVTAYGEDFLRLPDTFTKNNGFTDSPTDHYMRPFFLTGENTIGNLVCTKKLSSPNHILNYAYQFSDAYKREKYYGMFWINSISHNLNNIPTLFDNDLVNLFESLENNYIMKNTFIIFTSDHGMRYGSMRVPVESYYEERLPMCYIWVPTKFRELYPKEYANLQQNQDRLVTPYDLYLTMGNILQISQKSNEIITSEACPLCKSMFREVSPHRTCEDAGVDEKWCSCHNMSIVDKKHADVTRSLQVVDAYLQNRTKSTETIPCTECRLFKLKTIIRSHSYEDPVLNKQYYVIAFTVTPGDISYEVIVQKLKNDFSIVQSMDAITTYNSNGYCVKRPNDRGFCYCEKHKKCKIK